jgi:hypothetical protein
LEGLAISQLLVTHGRVDVAKQIVDGTDEYKSNSNDQRVDR